MPVVNKFFIVVQEDILPNFYNYMHRHNEFQITLIIKGDGILIAGNDNQPCKPGDIFFIGANQAHFFRSNPTHFNDKGQNNIHAVHIFINHQHSLSSILDLPELEALKDFIEGNVFALQAQSTYANDVANLILEVRSLEGIDRLIALIKLLKLCVTNAKQWKSFTKKFSNYNLKANEGPRMNDVYQYTHDHYADEISLDKIASIACITPNAFCKYFKKHTRKTYLAFLQEIRIDQACNKIINGDLDSISAVAYSTGFNSIITFNRVFKKVTSMTPKDYIQNYKLRKNILM